MSLEHWKLAAIKAGAFLAGAFASTQKTQMVLVAASQSSDQGQTHHCPMWLRKEFFPSIKLLKPMGGLFFLCGMGWGRVLFLGSPEHMLTSTSL